MSQIEAKNYSVTVSRGQLEGLIWSPRSKTNACKTILAIHGWLDNSQSFFRLAPLLAAEGHEVIAIDLWGHGLSPHKSEHESYHYLEWISDLNEIVDSMLGEEKITLMGHSLGGSICLNIAVLFPEKIEKLILLDAIGPLIDQGPNDFTERLRTFVLQKPKLTFLQKSFSNLDELVQRRVQASPMPEEGAKAIMLRNSSDKNGLRILNTDQKLRSISPLRLPKEHANELLSHLKIPSCILLQKGMPQSEYYKIYTQQLKKLPNIEEHFIEGGHFIHMEKEKECADIINTFLK